MKKKEIFVDVSPEKMQIRNYDPYLTVASTQVGWGDSKNDYLIVPKNEYRAFLKNKLKLSQYKCNALIKVYIDLDMIKEDKDYYSLDNLNIFVSVLNLYNEKYSHLI